MDTINNRDIFISVHALFACFDASSNNVAECLRKRILNCEYIRELQTADADAFITNRLSAIINVVDDEFSKFIAIQCANHALNSSDMWMNISEYGLFGNTILIIFIIIGLS